DLTDEDDIMRTLRTIVLAVLTLALPVLALTAQQKAELASTNSSSDDAYKVPDSLAGKRVDDWLRELRTTQDPSVKENVLRTRPLCGKDEKKAAPAVINLAYADGEDVSVRINACLALMTLEIPQDKKKGAVLALMRRLTDGQAVVRLHAAMALARFEEDAKEAIPSLIRSTKDTSSLSSWEIRKAAINALALAAKDKEKGRDARATAALLDVLRSQVERSSKVRLEAMMALGTMGKPGSPQTRQTVIQALQKERKARDRAMSVWAHVGLLLLDQPSRDNLDSLLNFLKDEDVPARAHAAYALGEVASDLKQQLAEKDVKEVTNALESAARDPE